MVLIAFGEKKREGKTRAWGRRRGRRDGDVGDLGDDGSLGMGYPLEVRILYTSML